MTGCVEWPWARSKRGYGQAWSRRLRALVYVHRAVWEVERGPIPDGLLVLHRCDNPPCANVDHLFLGTHADNMRDMAEKGRANGGSPSGPDWHRRDVSRFARGERHPQAKLTDRDVATIRAAYPQRTQDELAVSFDVHQTTIGRIVRGEIRV